MSGRSWTYLAGPGTARQALDIVQREGILEGTGGVPAAALHQANLGRVLLDLNEDADARDALESAAPALGDELLVWINLGVARFREGDLQQAAQAFEYARAADPSDSRPLLRLALVRARQGDRGAAADAMRQYLELGGREQAEGLRFIRTMERERGEATP